MGGWLRARMPAFYPALRAVMGLQGGGGVGSPDTWFYGGTGLSQKHLRTEGLEGCLCRRGLPPPRMPWRTSPFPECLAAPEGGGTGGTPQPPLTPRLTPSAHCHLASMVTAIPPSLGWGRGTIPTPMACQPPPPHQTPYISMATLLPGSLPLPLH